MFLLKCKINGKSHFLHDGTNFIGGNSFREAEQASLNNSAKAISVGGFDIVEMGVEELSEAIGGVPYTILHVNGGLIPFEVVEIVNERISSS